MRYGAFKEIIETAKQAFGIAGFEVHPGPDDPRIPGSYILLTGYPGPGLNTDDLFDGEGWQVKVVGEQHAYESGEDVAITIDRYLRSLYSGYYGGQWVTNFQRSGGSPSPLLVDDADRTHFVCSYIADVDSMAG